MIDEAEAIALAKACARQQGWGWMEPSLATDRRSWSGERLRWEVRSNASGRGTMVRVVIDAKTGAVLDKGYIPR